MPKGLKIPEPTPNDPMIMQGIRTPFGKSKTPKRNGILSEMRPEDVAAFPLGYLHMGLIYGGWGGTSQGIADVILGCVAGEGPQGYNVARIASRRAGIPDHGPSQTINRMCASGMESVASAAAKVKSGYAARVIAGGVECMSWIPMGIRDAESDPIPLSTIGVNFDPHPDIIERDPQAYIATVLGAELLAQQYGISRADQDRFAMRSHQAAIFARQTHVFDDEIMTTRGLLNDEGPREDTSFEKLASLKPLLQMRYTPEQARRFTGLNGRMAKLHESATVTAGNASQTTDGAAAMFVESRALVGPALCNAVRIVDYAVSGVAPEQFGIAPVSAIESILWRGGLTLQDIDRFEINEAFAAQTLAVIRELSRQHKVDEMAIADRTNVHGGAIAIGHPLGASGARLIMTLCNELKRSNTELGIASLCVGGGMGVAMLLKNESR